MLDIFFDHIPHQTADNSGAVSKCRQQVEVCIAVGSQLFIRQQIDLIDGISVLQFLHKHPSHVAAFRESFPPATNTSLRAFGNQLGGSLAAC